MPSSAPFYLSHSHIYSPDPNGPVDIGGSVEQGSKKKLSVPLISLRNRRNSDSLETLHSLDLTSQNTVQKLGCLWMGPIPQKELIILYCINTVKKKKRAKARNYIQMQQKCRLPVLMEPIMMHHTGKEKDPYYQRGAMMQPTSYASFVCNFCLCLLSATAATGACSKIDFISPHQSPPPANHQHQLQL